MVLRIVGSPVYNNFILRRSANQQIFGRSPSLPEGRVGKGVIGGCRRALSSSASPLIEFPIHVDIPVQWGDMDCFGHVNNVQYIKYFETARIAHFRAFKDAVIANGDEDKVDFEGFINAKSVGPILAR